MEKLKIPELKQICRDSGIKNYSKLRKAELIELIQSNFEAFVTGGQEREDEGIFFKLPKGLRQ